MKRLLILTVVLVLGSSAVGCRCCDWLWRGACYSPCPPGPPAVTCTDSCPPYNPCAPPAEVIPPGPAPYSVTPAQ